MVLKEYLRVLILKKVLIRMRKTEKYLASFITFRYIKTVILEKL
jgi:hypothetical protein